MKHKNIVIASLPQAYKLIKEISPATFPVQDGLVLSI
jgi:hypothetical protein